MGGQTAEDIVKQFNNPDTTILLDSGKEIPAKEIYTDVRPNENGTATYVFTANQLTQYKQFLCDVASLNRFINAGTTETAADTSIV